MVLLSLLYVTTIVNIDYKVNSNTKIIKYATRVPIPLNGMRGSQMLRSPDETNPTEHL